ASREERRERPDDAAAVEHHVQPGPGVIPEEAPDLRPPRRGFGPVDRHPDSAVVAPQVAGAGPGRQVPPLPDVAVPEDPSVILVRVPLHDAALELAADAALRAEGGAGADLRPEQVRP